MSLAWSLHNVATDLPHKPAVLFDDRMLTYAELDFESERLAQLIASGTMAGDRIVLHMHNGVEIAIAYFACFYAGAMAVPINTRMKDPEIRHVIEHTGSSIYVGQREPFGKLQEVGWTLRGVRWFIVDRRELDVWSEHLAATALPRVHADHPAVILYTSGSTALPKGVVHTHRSFLNAAHGLGITADDVVIIFCQWTIRRHSPCCSAALTRVQHRRLSGNSIRRSYWTRSSVIAAHTCSGYRPCIAPLSLHSKDGRAMWRQCSVACTHDHRYGDDPYSDV